MSLPIKIRQRLVSIFQIPQSSFSWVRDSVWVTDGRTIKDLELITTEKMRDLVNGGNFQELFLNLIDKIEMDDSLVNSAVLPEPTYNTKTAWPCGECGAKRNFHKKGCSLKVKTKRL